MFPLVLGSAILLVLAWIVSSEFWSGKVRVDKLAMTPLIAVTVVLSSVPPLLRLGDDVARFAEWTWLIGALLAIPATSFVTVSVSRLKGLAELGDDSMRSVGSLELMEGGTYSGRLARGLHRLKRELGR